MLGNRVIPVLLLSDGLLVKTRRFRSPVYVGDPINAVRIFNQKEVDELVILDMDPCRGKGVFNAQLIAEISAEAFMPVAYGGGIATVSMARQLVSSGVEKVIINSALGANTQLIGELAAEFGSQAVVASVDYRTKRFGRPPGVVIQGGRRELDASLLEHIRACERAGIGEVLLTSVDRDGEMQGLDLDQIRKVSASLDIPLIACGGAGSVADLRAGIQAGASAVAAASMFVFHGPHRAVLITYPDRDVLRTLGGSDAD